MKPTALVIDDEPDIRELLSITLDRMDIATRTAEDVASAKRMLTGHTYDLCPSPSGSRMSVRHRSYV